MNKLAVQEWDDQAFCDSYESTWEISTEEAHYGWLAPGENTLNLLKDIDLEDAAILDAGCGMGQNLVALTKKGAKGYGLDISPCMLAKANAIIEEQGLNENIELEEGDMRSLSCFQGITFDVILSIYSMEYLSGVQELRRVLHHFNQRLKPGGLLIMCFSHPSQAHRYPEFTNSSVPIGVGKFRTFNYSVRDAVQELSKNKFEIERVIEQATENPSQIMYEEGRKFPYHFRDGSNPCDLNFDDISNGNPHTIIYKARKPYDYSRTSNKKLERQINYKEIWGYKRRIIRIGGYEYLGLRYKALFLAPMDNVVGVSPILHFKVSANDIQSAKVELDNDKLLETSPVPAKSALAIINNRLQQQLLEPVYRQYNILSDSERNAEKRVLLEGIIGLDKKIEVIFPDCSIGLLAFVNGNEPSKGELAIDEVNVKPGDHIELMYVAYRERRQNGSNTPQLTLL